MQIIELKLKNVSASRGQLQIGHAGMKVGEGK